jgi:hypothetical protein
MDWIVDGYEINIDPFFSISHIHQDGYGLTDRDRKNLDRISRFSGLTGFCCRDQDEINRRL